MYTNELMLVAGDSPPPPATAADTSANIIFLGCPMVLFRSQFLYYLETKRHTHTHLVCVCIYIFLCLNFSVVVVVILLLTLICHYLNMFDVMLSLLVPQKSVLIAE